MAFAEDFDVFINDDTPGYVVATFGGESIPCIFDNLHIDVNFVGSNNPTMTAKTSDLTGVSTGSDIIINGSTYRVLEMQDEKTGITDIELRFKQ